MVFAGLVCIALALSAEKTFAITRQIIAVNSRETARIWIADNLPPGAKIAIESYAPFVDPARFSVQGFGMMIEHEPDWYIEQEFDYLVFGQGMYGRFFLDPGRYGAEVIRYNKLFEHFHLIVVFADGVCYEVLVYEVK